MSKPTSGELFAARFKAVRDALDALNYMWTSGDITHMADDDIRQLMKARRHLTAVRYRHAMSDGNPDKLHG